MKSIAECLGVEGPEVVSIFGCGGKTTLLWGLATIYGKKERVLVSTTTKIGRPAAPIYDSLTGTTDLHKLIAPGQTLPPGVHLAGELSAEANHVKSIPAEDLETLLPSFDKVFLECDGSRNLPVKGWAEHEPVIPPYTSLSVGIATLWAEGRAIDQNTVHRPEIFCALASAQMGDRLTLEHMAAAIAHPAGLMGKACGRKLLLINQLESEADMIKAEKLLELLPENFLHGLERVVGASLHNRRARILLRN